MHCWNRSILSSSKCSSTNIFTAISKVYEQLELGVYLFFVGVTFLCPSLSNLYLIFVHIFYNKLVSSLLSLFRPSTILFCCFVWLKRNKNKTHDFLQHRNRGKLNTGSKERVGKDRWYKINLNLRITRKPLTFKFISLDHQISDNLDQVQSPFCLKSAVSPLAASRLFAFFPRGVSSS